MIRPRAVPLRLVSPVSPGSACPPKRAPASHRRPSHLEGTRALLHYCPYRKTEWRDNSARRAELANLPVPDNLEPLEQSLTTRPHLLVGVVRGNTATPAKLSGNRKSSGTLPDSRQSGLSTVSHANSSTFRAVFGSLLSHYKVRGLSTHEQHNTCKCTF